MAEVLEIEKPDKTPLLKEKKPRPPQSEKQMANFKIMQEKGAKRAEERKQTKILQAQRALLEKEGYVKATPKVEPVQFEIEEEEEALPTPLSKSRAKPKIKETRNMPPIQTPKVKQVKRVKPIPEPESESSGDSDSSEEVIIIKRKSKKTKSPPMKLSKRPIESDDEEDEYVGKSIQIDYNGFFC